MSVDLAIVIPVFNEAGNVLPLAKEILSAFEGQALSFEILFVDDCSSDATPQQVVQAGQEDARVRGLRLAKRSGQSAAIWTGIQATASPLIATLDGDLQNDPADLPAMLAMLQSCDFVCGCRTKRQDRWIKKISSRVAFAARQAVLGAAFKDTGCGLRVFKRSALQGVFPFNGLHRFLPILAQGGGARVREVPVRHRPRLQGTSKYGLWNRLGRGIWDLLAMAWYQRRRLSPLSYTELKTSRPSTNHLTSKKAPSA